MKTLPLTVLMHNSPIGRAYLGILRAKGYRVERLLLMVYRHHPSTRKPMGRWLPVKSWRMRYLAWGQDVLLNHWARFIERKHPEFYSELTQTVAQELAVPLSVLQGLTAAPDWRQYAERVESVLVDGLNDGVLHERLAEETDNRAVLFTGGGLVPKELLSIKGLKVLHIHPGRLPDVRGADGLLWSVLVRGRPGASCFYMDPGLDTGAIVERMEFEPLNLGKRWLEEVDQRLLYRAVFAFVDPLVRARLLAQLLDSGYPLHAIPSDEQDTPAGVVYHFMHPRLQKKALSRLFSGT